MLECGNKMSLMSRNACNCKYRRISISLSQITQILQISIAELQRSKLHEEIQTGRNHMANNFADYCKYRRYRKYLPDLRPLQHLRFLRWGFCIFQLDNFAIFAISTISAVYLRYLQHLRKPWMDIFRFVDLQFSPFLVCKFAVFTFSGL